jgi:LmbE family N-acetylglucosaminyl deacetylase
MRFSASLPCGKPASVRVRRKAMVATLVSFHAHPDDEAIACGGTLARASAEGHRVVVVFGTRGEHGEVADGFLHPGEALGDRRVEETNEAARILGVHRVEFLPYVDSGMAGTTTNEEPASFWKADVVEASERLAAILTEERADVLTVYDEAGGYHHPDHIKVHFVGLEAAAIAGIPKVYENVISRELIQRGSARLLELGLSPPVDPEATDMGVSESTITTEVDVEPFLELKRAAMAAHASQIPETSFFLSLPPDMFQWFFAKEYYRLRGAPPGLKESGLLGVEAQG